MAALSLPADCRRIILVGGTFDPVHLAHVALPQAARVGANIPDAHLLYIPAARSPFKADSPRASDQDRVAMLKLALREVPNASIWTDEIDRASATNSPSYTIDTLRRLRTVIAPDTQLRLLIGADQAATFHKWREPRAILSFAPPLVMLRGADSATLLNSLRAAEFWNDQEMATWSASVVPTPLSPISSTLLRDLLAVASPVSEQELAASLDPAVLQYIRTQGLYRD
ncbi:MAG: nicotinate-nicotinamide nucleotide adenylyltransferase [Phycisphaeraceae bacterium]|nr:nicotinate-nicotinamide nucleotide adenylyltransferase [Phycisphaeraceae bacterium]